MPQIFPKSFNQLPLKAAIILATVFTSIILGLWYYNTPKYTRVGYQPVQPIAFSHSIHVAQIGLDCRFCHTFVKEEAHANLPTSDMCYKCHNPAGIRWDSPKLEPLKRSISTGQPIQWIQVHQLPDYVYFNHAVHYNRGIHCSMCHGTNVRNMEVIYHDQPLSMSWCLDCHRQPEKKILPIFKPYIAPGFDKTPPPSDLTGQELVKQWNVHPPTTCYGCHR